MLPIVWGEGGKDQATNPTVRAKTLEQGQESGEGGAPESVRQEAEEGVVHPPSPRAAGGRARVQSCGQ